MVTLIIAILSFVGVYLNVVVSAILLISGRFGIFDMLLRWLGSNGYTYGIMPFISASDIAPQLISNIISCAINGVLFISAMRCFSAELADGTPFSHRFADEVRTLGIKTIILPIIGVIVSSIVYVCFGTIPEVGLSNGASTVVGVCLVLFTAVRNRLNKTVIFNISQAGRNVMKKVFYLLAAVLIAALLIFCWFYGAELLGDNSENVGIGKEHENIDDSSENSDRENAILKGVRGYIQTKPKYKSKYYSGGYPDDGFGVCTDVVAFGMKNAGLDLRELVNADIEENGADYGIDVPDKNIDFRRVKNLKVYFEHTAESLTTDINKTDEWQGGDIVVFKNHIGVISDKRNKHGVPYVIHHIRPNQKHYEEDILRKRHDIVGHFRIKQ